MPRGLPVALGLLTLDELLAQVGVLVRAAHVRMLAGLLGQSTLRLLALLLHLTKLAGVLLGHAGKANVTTTTWPRSPRRAAARRRCVGGAGTRAVHPRRRQR